jgi:hypothetical protein
MMCDERRQGLQIDRQTTHRDASYCKIMESLSALSWGWPCYVCCPSMRAERGGRIFLECGLMGCPQLVFSWFVNDGAVKSSVEYILCFPSIRIHRLPSVDLLPVFCLVCCVCAFCVWQATESVKSALAFREVSLLCVSSSLR